jgi:SPX domain protein involved in polyphosphate accumulation
MKFGHRLQNLACDMWWEGEHIDYKGLKKTLKMHASPSENESAFLATVLAEVHKVRRARSPLPALPSRRPLARFA